MKKLLLIAVSIVLPGVPALAAPCAPGTLAAYIAMGSAGCSLGNLHVAGFTYKAKAGGGAGEITADQINVTPLLAPTGTFGLQFSAPWSVQAGQSQGSNISYRVLTASTAPVQVQQVRLDGDGFKAGLFGSVVVNESLATPTVTQALQVYLKCTEVCRSQTSAERDLTPPVSMLIVLDQATLRSKLGAASMSSFTDWLVTCIPCV